MKDRKILFISHFNFICNDFTGGQKLAKTHYAMIESIFGKENTKLAVLGEGENTKSLFFLGKNKSKKQSFFYSIRGYIRGYSSKAERQIIDILRRNDFDYVFCDFSCYGTTLGKIKKIKKNIKVISFFHDVESNYEINRMKNENPFYFFSYLSAKKQERHTVCFSDKTIALNDRDKKIIGVKYKRNVDLVLPIVTEDKFSANAKEKINGEFLLFVGSLFGPNLDGIKWYIKNVAPCIKYKTLVVGKGFETLRDELSCDNVEIVGTVEDVSNYYNGAKAVVMPILYGDGMKVKTAEALMYGKTVIGTLEAFEGYDIKNGQEGYCVNTPEEFIDIINNGKLIEKNVFSRNLYEQKYSLSACSTKLKKLFDELETEG